MTPLLLAVILSSHKPNFEMQYLDTCYPSEANDPDTCKRRQERWRSSIKQYEEESAKEELEQRAGNLKSLTARLPKMEPEKGTEKIEPMAPAWCDAVDPKDKDAFNGNAIAASLESFNGPRGHWAYLFKAAAYLCAAPPEEEIVKTYAGLILQGWVNRTGLNKENALASLKLRLSEERFKASHKKLCSELVVSEEVEGQEKIFGKTLRQLFSCGATAAPSGLWGDVGSLDDAFDHYWDTPAATNPELLRLALVLVKSNPIFLERNDSFHAQVGQYAVDQFDYRAFDPAKVLKELDEPPYKDNEAARILVLESLGRVRLALAAWDEEIKKRTAKDPDWKQLLLDAPQKGFDDYSKQLEKWKEQVTRSNEFELKFFGPSRKAVKGCGPTLRKDFAAFMKTKPHGTPKDLKAGILGDPIGNLLLSRLAACESIEGNSIQSAALWNASNSGRYARGARQAAYYAALDALSTILKDRQKFPIKAAGLRRYGSRELYSNSGGGTIVSMDGEGTVKSVGKNAQGVAVTFVTERGQREVYDCKRTNRIWKIESDGRIIYDEDCVLKGHEPTSSTEKPMTVPPEFAGGITAGRYVRFRAEHKDNRLGFPIEVFADKKQKTLTAWNGFGL